MRNSLIYYWRINAAVVVAAAVATAVLTGALLVGDSVRGSLRDLTLDRLGAIDYLLVKNDFFREDLVAELSQQPGFGNDFKNAAPGIFLTGTSINAKTKARASQINIIGLDDRFTAFYALDDSVNSALGKKPGQIFPAVIINQSLQNELKSVVGDQVLLSFGKPSDIARGALLGDKDTEDVVESIRLTLTKVVPDADIGRFGIRPNQTLPLNAFVPLKALQKALEQKDKVNTMLVSQFESAETIDKSDILQTSLKSVLRFEDLGLKLKQASNHLILESKESVFSQQAVTMIENLTNDLGMSVLPAYTYLANKIEANDRLLPYSTVTGFDLKTIAPFSELNFTGDNKPDELKNNDILLNSWAASDLNVQSGDTVTMTYFAVGARDELYEKQAQFKVAGIVAMSGLAVDTTLTPDFPGMADADNMIDWNPPFAIDLSLIRPKDEDYWDAYRGTPKAFVSLKTAQELWGSRFGNITSIKIAPAANSTLEETQAVFQQKLLEKAKPGQFNYVFQPVKAQGLASSSGATDFGGLFIGFSMFLIVASALLVGLLFRLGVENRAKEIGLLLAVGYQVKLVRRQFLKEGSLLAAIGALVGLAGAVGYAWLMMTGLRTWWVAAVGSPFLFLHVAPDSLVMGYFISICVVVLSIWLGFRKLSKIPPPALLAGVTVILHEKKSVKRAKVTAYVALVLAAAMTAVSFTMEQSEAAGVFFGVGALLLIAALAFFSMWLRAKHKMLTFKTGCISLLKMAMRNSPRNPGRSMLSAALVGCACFVIVAVGANRVNFGAEVLKKDSGAGGFSLIAQTDIPVNHDLSTEDGRYALGFSDSDSEILKSSEIVPFRFLPGDDASCLNLYQVEKPRILGVPQAQIKRGGFKFQALAESETANSWELLNQEIEPDVIPAFGDYNSVLWILHSGLGKDIKMTDEFGREIRLRFVGLLKKSIFQSELLISEENFLKHFPSRSGYSYFLIQTPPDQIETHAVLLEHTLSDYGFDSSTTVERLMNYQAVENTYLSTFQTLGGLGLLLGTLGLGMILIRNVIERRGELATLRAFGFKRATLALIVLAENGFLLVLGILIGTVSAVIAVAPHVLADVSQVPWLSLFLTLIVVFIVGMLASSFAVSQALRIPLLPALRAE